jgi:hypothetical protein
MSTDPVPFARKIPKVEWITAWVVKLERKYKSNRLGNQTPDPEPLMSMEGDTMRKPLAVAVISTLLLTFLPQAAMAGDTHAVRNRWAGVGVGVAAATLGGLILGSLFQPAPVVAAPPVMSTPPPVVFYTPPSVVYASPPVVYYAPPPVVIYHGWGPPPPPRGWHRGHGHHYHR